MGTYPACADILGPSYSPLHSSALSGIARHPPHTMPCLSIFSTSHQPPSAVVPLDFCQSSPGPTTCSSERGLVLHCAADGTCFLLLMLVLLCSALLCSSVQNQVDEVIDVMQENITKVIERGERLDDLQDKSGVMINALLSLSFSLHLFPTAGPGYLI